MAILALLLAASAIARTTVRDGKRETSALSKNGRLDIIRATGDRQQGNLVFTVTMREQVRRSATRERPAILINTRGNRRSDPEFAAFGNRVFRVRNRDDVAIGEARLGARGRTWTYRFKSNVIPNLDRFGWAAATNKGRAFDIAPDDRYARARARTLQAAIAR